MIKSISFQNYKAFEKGNLKIKPLTLLLGANSVGKSSIFQLLLMLQQTAMIDEEYNSPLKLYGGVLNLGENENLFKNKNINKPIILSTSIQDADLYKYLKSGIIQSFNVSILRNAFLFFQLFDETNKKLVSKINDSFLSKTSLTNSSIEEQKKTILYAIDNIPKNPRYKKFLNKNSINDILSKPGDSNLVEFLPENRDSLLFCTEFIYQFSASIESDILDYTFSIVCEKHSNQLTKQKVEIFNNEKMLFGFTFSLDGNLESVLLPFFNNKYNFNYLKEFKKILRGNQSLFSIMPENIGAKENEKQTPFYQFSRKILSRFAASLKSEFGNNNINHVGPLRAHPRRYYFLDKAKVNLALDALDGDTLTEIIKGNSLLREKANSWFKRFNIAINVEKFKDVVHSLKITQNSLELDITDVGFGISQILPVVIQGFLSRNNSITLIEQPEIHLHPKMQADLADLFIDIVQSSHDKGKHLIIETHSEYLIKRIRRRISQGIISADDVGIYLVQKEGNDSLINELAIEPKGRFEYPRDYFVDDILDDTIEFLKNQD